MRMKFLSISISHLSRISKTAPIRLHMVTLLKERAWYLHELASKLNMTSPAVSHHISSFGKLDLVEALLCARLFLTP